MKSQYWCSDCGYLFVVKFDEEVERCPACLSKHIVFEMSVVNDRVYLSKKAHNVNKYA